MKVSRSLLTPLLALLQIILVTWWFENQLVIYGGLITASLVLLWMFSFSKPYMIMFFLTGISGFFAEAIVVTNGAWIYSTQNIFGLPYWLFFLWGSIGVACTYFGHNLIKRYGK